MLSGIGLTIAQGTAFGTGSAIAHCAIGATLGAMSSGDGGEQGQYEQQPVNTMQQQQLHGVCALDKQMFLECLQVKKVNQEDYSFLYKNLQQYQHNADQISFS
jgi:hypothetical protein